MLKIQVFGGVERKRFLRKHVIRQKMRNFAPLFGVVRALVRYIECRVECMAPLETGRGIGEKGDTKFSTKQSG